VRGRTKLSLENAEIIVFTSQKQCLIVCTDVLQTFVVKCLEGFFFLYANISRLHKGMYKHRESLTCVSLLQTYSEAILTTIFRTPFTFYNKEIMNTKDASTRRL